MKSVYKIGGMPIAYQSWRYWVYQSCPAWKSSKKKFSAQWYLLWVEALGRDRVVSFSKKVARPSRFKEMYIKVIKEQCIVFGYRVMHSGSASLLPLQVLDRHSEWRRFNVAYQASEQQSQLGICLNYLHLRNLTGFKWNLKCVYRVCKDQLNLKLNLANVEFVKSPSY
jgi:hypothetical protein